MNVVEYVEVITLSYYFINTPNVLLRVCVNKNGVQVKYFVFELRIAICKLSYYLGSVDIANRRGSYG